MTTIKNDHPVVLTPIEDIKPYPKNAKLHDKKQVDKLVALIQRFGWSAPIVIQKSTKYIIAGQGRRLAAIQLGLARVPTIILNVNDEEASAMRIADNRVVSTEYDAIQLKEEVIDLIDLGFDTSILGFDEKEFTTLIADMSALNESAFVDDISTAVEEQKEANQAKQDLIDDSHTPLRDALGFTKVTVLQSRRLRGFMTKIEAETGAKGAAALMQYLDTIGVA